MAHCDNMTDAMTDEMMAEKMVSSVFQLLASIPFRQDLRTLATLGGAQHGFCDIDIL